MAKFWIFSVFLVFTVKDCYTQFSADTFASLLTNENFRDLLTQSGNISTELGELFEFYNSTGNLTGAIGVLFSDERFSSLAVTAGKILFESLSIEALTKAEVSQECQEDVVVFAEELVSRRDWALQMIDAMAKPGANIESKRFKFLGSYEQCTNIRATHQKPNGEVDSFNGQYCSAAFYMPGIPAMLFFFGAGYIQFGLCIPSTCTSLDLKKMIGLAEYTILNGTVPLLPEVTCQEGPEEVDSALIVAIIILGVLGCLVVFGTVYDVLTVQMKSASPYSVPEKQMPVVFTQGTYKLTEANGLHMNGKAETEVKMENEEPVFADNRPPVVEQPKPEKSMLEKVLLAFSVYTNGVKILSTEQAGSLGAVNGIRFLSMAWVILGHSYYFAARYDTNLFEHFMKKTNEWTFMGIIYADVSVDSFFTLSGLLVAYLSLKQLDKVGGAKGLNWFMYYFHRFWRLTPPYMLVIMVGTIILPYTLYGPMWNYENMDYMGDCRTNWWTNLLYVNNYVRTERSCMGWTWYLANDMQYYWISPLLILPLFYHIGAGIVSCLAFLIASTVAVGVIAYDHRYPAQAFLSGLLPEDRMAKDGDYSDNLYQPSYARIGPYIVGVFTGYMLYRWKCKCKIPKILNLICWILSIGLTTTLIYSRYSRDGNHLLTVLQSSVYHAVNRTAWGIALGWIIFACATGNGGWINQVLSWKPFIPLGRLSYCAYLIHPLVMMMFYSSRMETTLFNDYEVIYLFLAHLTLTYGLSFLVSLVFESPMMGLEKAIFDTGRK